MSSCDAELTRRFSQQSNKVLAELKALQKNYLQLESRTDEIEKVLLENNYTESELSHIKNQIAQLNGYLENLQFQGVDSVVIAELQTGRKPARELRKELIRQCEELQKRIAVLHKRANFKQ